MLKVIPIQNRAQVESLFSQFNPREQTWLVSDLRTKFELQSKILDRDGQFLDTSVLRASDLWKIMLKRVEPRLKIVSDAFARAVLRSMLDETGTHFGINSTAEETLFSYIDELVVILFHPEGRTRIKDWFENHEEAKNRWGDWYDRAWASLLSFIEGKKIITADWLTAFLQNYNNIETVWTTPLIVDLGGEISRTEAEILRGLSRTIDIIVLEPSPHWKSEYSYLLQPYEDLRLQAQVVMQPLVGEQKSEVTKKVEVLRFSGMLAEIKHSVGQVREWLEAGVLPQSISIIAPDIEAYWPIMQLYLKQEGIPFQKDISLKIQTLPDVMEWVSTLRAKSGRLSNTDIELSFYHSEHADQVRYEEFKALFSSLYVFDDLNRHELIQKAFTGQIDLTGSVTQAEFVASAIALWRGQDEGVLIEILREVLKNTTSSMQLAWKIWLSYLEVVVATLEFTAEKGQPQGIVVTKIMSAQSEKSKYRIFLGLTDEAMKRRNKTQLSGDDYFQIAKDLGFYLDSPDQCDLEFELRLLAEADSKEDIYSFGVSDLKGTLCSPCNFWMQQSGDHEHLKIPKLTRWDELQGSDQRGDRAWTCSRKQNILKRIGQDKGEFEADKIKMTKLPRISASAIENFLKCPFVFATTRFFHLKDLPEVDLDVDQRTRGQLAHALFERLSAEPIRFDWTAEDIEKVLESIREEKKLILADERLWGPLKNKHITLAQKFLKFEKAWRDEFINLKTVGREVRFAFYIDPVTFEVNQESKEDAFYVSGQIDRIDSDHQQHLAIIDYKSSSANVSAHASWIKNNHLQMLFYMWVIEKGLVSEIQGEVIGLFYYIFKNFERKGFKIEELSGSLFGPSKKRDKNGTLEVKDAYLKSFSDLLMETLDRIKQGECSPIPSDFDNCKTCEWRRLCRAPHLN